jgi:hypothetical protein
MENIERRVWLEVLAIRLEVITKAIMGQTELAPGGRHSGDNPAAHAAPPVDGRMSAARHLL